MEPAKIDWKRVNSIFVVDDLYEHINAPKFVDFSAPDEHVDDEAWFCRPDCNHPKTVEDFLKSTPPSKIQRSASVSEVLPLRNRKTRDSNLKRRELTQPSCLPNKDSKCDRYVEDGENQNPNFFSTPSHQFNILKATIKSSTEKRQIANPTKKEETPRLRSTLSARNLFGGRDLMNHISEFCNELKRLATRAKETENVEKSDVKKVERKECDGGKFGETDEREKERKPLLEVSREECEVMQKSNLKEKLRKKRADEVENKPSPMNLKTVNRAQGENLLQIRTNPPSPQCFSANHGPDKTAPLKASRSKPQERGILQELEQGSITELKKEKTADTKSTGGKSASSVAEREARTLDVFWFLKPCTLSDST